MQWECTDAHTTSVGSYCESLHAACRMHHINHSLIISEWNNNKFFLTLSVWSELSLFLTLCVFVRSFYAWFFFFFVFFVCCFCLTATQKWKSKEINFGEEKKTLHKKIIINDDDWNPLTNAHIWIEKFAATYIFPFQSARTNWVYSLFFSDRWKNTSSVLSTIIFFN